MAWVARAELMGFVGQLLADKRRAALVAAELELEAEEIALLMGSNSGTKKVMAIYEEAQRIRAAEEFEEIELGWQSTAQRSLGSAQQAPQAGAESVPPAEAKPEGAAEPAKPEAAPAAGPQTEQAGGPDAAAPVQARKRGRPKKAEGEGKAEKKSEAGAGKRQKSLFDF